MDFRKNTHDTTHYARTATVAAAGTEVDAGLRAYMLGIYNYMASALALTGIVAFLAANSEAFINTIYTYNETSQVMSPSLLGWVIALAPLATVIYLSVRIERMSIASAQMAFWGFAILMGLSMTSIVLAYTGESIARTFFITAGTFGAMSIYGYTTKRDLTGMGSFLFMGLIGIILASIVNLFLGSSVLGFAISVIGVLVFVGLTAYDTQRLKNIYYHVAASGEAMAKSTIMGALNLYLDFINLFIMLLHLTGDRR